MFKSQLVRHGHKKGSKLLRTQFHAACLAVEKLKTLKSYSREHLLKIMLKWNKK